jgi:hypothetical protein
MSYQMKLDEMQEALRNADHPQADAFEAALCAIGDAMAAALAARFYIIAGEAAQAGAAFAGIASWIAAVRASWEPQVGVLKADPVHAAARKVDERFGIYGDEGPFPQPQREALAKLREALLESARLAPTYGERASGQPRRVEECE